MLEQLWGSRGPVLSGERVRLRPPRMHDHRPWAELREASRDFLERWEPAWPADDLGRAAFRRRVDTAADDIRAGAAWPLLVFRQSDQALTGGLTLSNVRRGVSQTATLGYWCGAAFARQGLTLDAVETAVAFAFGQLNLHRLEAACVPENAPSAALLTRAGFQEEGLATGYLKIGGVWRDHRLFARVAPDAIAAEFGGDQPKTATV